MTVSASLHCQSRSTLSLTIVTKKACETRFSCNKQSVEALMMVIAVSFTESIDYIGPLVIPKRLKTALHTPRATNKLKSLRNLTNLTFFKKNPRQFSLARTKVCYNLGSP